jgi:nitrite reductase (NADH) small subunit
MKTTTRTTWTDVCPFDILVPGRGVAALVDGEQVAIFRVGDELFALGNLDPFSNAHVMSRGIVGTRNGVVKVASPMYKQTFDLRTGVCFEQPDVSIPVWSVRCVDGRVEVLRP